MRSGQLYGYRVVGPWDFANGLRFDPSKVGHEAREAEQSVNFVVTLLALGMAMILMGDEARRTQSGNNNAYCQENEISWFDWTLLDKHVDVHGLVRLLNARRLLRDVEHERRCMTLNQLIAQASMAWHGVRLGQPDWTTIPTASLSRRSSSGTGFSCT